MKRQPSLATLGLWARSYRWAELRRFQRSEAEGAFAGLTLRHRNHIVRLFNWSPGGVCVELPGAARIGERVQIVSGKLRRRGRVVWIGQGRAGVEFDG